MKYLIIIFSLIGFSAFACESESSMSNNDLQIWLGKKSEFSKTLNKSKCLLDKELMGLSLNNKKLIAKLILRSYEIEENANTYSF